MKSFSVVFALVLLVVTPAFSADGAPATDKEKLVQHLERTREKF